MGKAIIIFSAMTLIGSGLALAREKHRVGLRLREAG